MDMERNRIARRAAGLSLLAALGLIAAKLAAAIASGSLALFSEAAHSTLDAGASGLTYLAVRVGTRPPDEEHPYGHGKAENLSALIETIGLLALSVFIAVTAVSRLGDETTAVQAEWYAFAVILLSIAVDANRARLLRRIGREQNSPALQADALHFTADLLTSTVVLVGFVFIRFGYPAADAIGSLFIAGYVAYSSVVMGRRSIDALMDRAPQGAMEKIGAAAMEVEGVEEVRRVRVRRVGGHTQADVVIAISRRVPLETAHHVTEEVEKQIREMDPGADVVVKIEPLANEQAVTQKVEAVATRDPDVSEVHNIFVTSHPDGLLVSLHVKFPGQMTLAEAHAIAERVESEIRGEVEGVLRVDTHLEPLDEPGPGRDVTLVHTGLVEWATGLAEQQPEVQNCHEVIVSESGGKLALVMHCEAAPGLSISQVHQASTRIEDEVHRQDARIGRVTVHFEPVGTA